MTIAAMQNTDFNRPVRPTPLTPTTNPAIQPRDDALEAADKGDRDFSFFGEDGLTFWDVLDAVNPLQHIPVVNSIYRHMTGDQIDPAMKLAGGCLFGGVFGLGMAAVDVAIDGATGKDIGEHVVALATGDYNGESVPKHDRLIAENGSLRDDVGQSSFDALGARPDSRPKDDLTHSDALHPLNNSLGPIDGLQPQTSLNQADLAALETRLPDWNAGSSSVQSDGVARYSKDKQGDKVAEKVFPVPPRSNLSAKNIKSLAQLRADSNTTNVTTGSMSAAPQLSPEAMNAAGLTQDMVDDILSRGGRPPSRSQKAEKPEQRQTSSGIQTASIDGPVTASKDLENRWFYSNMTQALDKYQAANDRKANDVSGVNPVRMQEVR